MGRNIKRRKKQPDDYYAVGPGPMGLKNVGGVFTQGVLPQGRYAVAYDDKGEDRLQSDSTFTSYDQAMAMADWLNRTRSPSPDKVLD